MLRSAILTLALALGSSLADSAVAVGETTRKPETKPNIVFIFADDWGWGDLGCHGSKWLRTPNLDRLAREGADFHQFNVLNPVCSPSRTAAMTGQYPARWSVHQHFADLALNRQHGMPDWLDPQAPMLPRILKQAGYRTGHFGKWHLTNRGADDAPQPPAYGFDEWATYTGPGPQAGLHDTASNAAKFIRAHKNEPFYLNVWLHESHTPHVPTEESLKQHAGLDPQKQVYAAVISDGDKAVGQVLAALKEAGVEQNTLVIFSSDNGPESTGPERNKQHRANAERGLGTYYSVGETGGLRGRKRSLFEGGVRVPFIVRWPGHTPAGIVDTNTVITAVDLLPTLCAAAGVSLPNDYQPDGENLLAAFNGQTVKRTKPIFWEWRGNANPPHWWPRLAVRDGDWKLYLDPAKSRAELYHLARDRTEQHDVAPEQPETVTRLKQLALAWKATLPEQPNAECISRLRTATTSDPQTPSVSRAWPKFSWDRVPLYMHVRKRTDFADAELAYLARFPLLTFEKATGSTTHGSTEQGTLAAARAVKKLNPDTRILFYRNVIVHYPGYAANQTLDQIPGALLADADGADKLVRGRVGAYDLSNPAVRRWWVNICAEAVRDPAIDGIFVDGNVKVLEPGYLTHKVGAAKKRAEVEGYHLMMEATRRAVGPEKLLVGNVIRASLPNAGVDQLALFDGAYIEGFQAKVQGASYEDYVAKGIAAVQQAAQQGKLIAFTVGLGNTNNALDAKLTSPTSVADARHHFGLALFLICAGEYTYFQAHDGFNADNNPAWMRWYPEYDKPLGPPRDVARRDGWTYTREFAHASVRVNLKTREARINWKP